MLIQSLEFPQRLDSVIQGEVERGGFPSAREYLVALISAIAERVADKNAVARGLAERALLEAQPELSLLAIEPEGEIGYALDVAARQHVLNDLRAYYDSLVAAGDEVVAASVVPAGVRVEGMADGLSTAGQGRVMLTAKAFDDIVSLGRAQSSVSGALADGLVRTAFSAFDELAGTPSLGRASHYADESLRGTRRWAIPGAGDWVVFYMPLPPPRAGAEGEGLERREGRNGVMVIRVLSEASSSRDEFFDRYLVPKPVGESTAKVYI